MTDVGRRILCIDGGGILGIVPAAFLAELESHLNRPIGEYFDLIAGTSTGGILALGLASGMPARDIALLYESRGPEIFGDDCHAWQRRLVRLLRTIRQLGRPKHSPASLRSVLAETFSDRKIGHARTRVLIPAWNSTSRSVYIFKTAHHPRLRTDYKVALVDAALATSAAPTYFPQHMTENAVGLFDGGVWANNPIALAVVEAISVLGWPAESLQILSLGCLDEAYTVPRRAGMSGLGSKLINLFMDGQSHGAMGIAKLLTGDEHHRTAIHRINHTVPRKAFAMDDTNHITELAGLGRTMARNRFPVLHPIFFQSPAEVFQPVYALDTDKAGMSISGSDFSSLRGVTHGR